MHPKCKFQTNKSWTNGQFHNDHKQSMKTPEELEDEMNDPPRKIGGEVLDRVQGSIIGMALGDALGAHVEFRPHEYLVAHPVDKLEGGGTWGLRKGQFTDDTSMALCLANSLIARGDFIPYDQMVRYKWWYKYGYMSSTGKCFDIGAATKDSLQQFEQTQEIFAKENDIPIDQIDFLSDPDLLRKFQIYCSKDGVAGNGALMRLAPVPLFFWRSPEKAVEYSGISGTITHGDVKAHDACRLCAAIIVAAFQGESKDHLLSNTFYTNHESWFSNNGLHEDIQRIAQGSYKKEGGYKDGIRGKGYIVSALEAALWAFWSDDNSFEKGALNAVNLGDDTDTTAAIYGQLAGAYYGYNNLPKEWLKYVYGKKFMECLSKWIVYEGNKWSNFYSSNSENMNDSELYLPPSSPIPRPRCHTVHGSSTPSSHSNFNKSESAAAQEASLPRARRQSLMVSTSDDQLQATDELASSQSKLPRTRDRRNTIPGFGPDSKLIKNSTASSASSSTRKKTSDTYNDKTGKYDSKN